MNFDNTSFKTRPGVVICKALLVFSIWFILGSLSKPYKF